MQNSSRAKKAAKTRAKAKLRKPNAARQQFKQATNDKRLKAYSAMESHVCDLARAAELAMAVSDNANLFLFAVNQLDDLAHRFRSILLRGGDPPLKPSTFVKGNLSLTADRYVRANRGNINPRE